MGYTVTYSVDVIEARLDRGTFSREEAQHAINDLEVHYQYGTISSNYKDSLQRRLREYL